MKNSDLWMAMASGIGMLEYNNINHDHFPERKKQKIRKTKSEAFTDEERRKRTKEKKRIKKQKRR
jgi:hypothetical protein